MSGKRFKIRYGTISTNYPSGRIFDNKKQHSLYLDEVVDLLNSQSDALLSYDKLVNDLKEENEQLKKQNKQLRKLIDWSEINIADLIGDGV